MKPKLMYVENKAEGHTGEAWIAYVEFSKTGQTIYFNNKALKKFKTTGINSNHFDMETRENYWVAAPKKNGQDRHKNGSGQIQVCRLLWRETVR